MRLMSYAAAASLAAAFTVGTALAVEISGAGATFPDLIYAKWADAYEKETGAPDASKQALAFFDWAYKEGDGLAGELDYIPLPDSVVDLVHEGWQAIKDSSGKPLFAMN